RRQADASPAPPRRPVCARGSMALSFSRGSALERRSIMGFTSWLGKRQPSARSRCGSPSKRPRYRLRLEALEDRWLPSTLTVLNNLDSGGGSLRGEIAIAASGDTIVFDKSLAGQTIKLTSGELVITKSLTIDGLGADKLTISGNNA